MIATPRTAAKAVRTWLVDRKIEFVKVTGREISFQDLLRADGVFVTVTHKCEWQEQWMTDIRQAFKPETCGFHVEFTPNMLRPKPVEEKVA